MTETLSHDRGALAPAAFANPGFYPGPERRGTASAQAMWLTRMLDEIDYGMLLVSADAHVTYLNHAARVELDGRHPLQLLGRTLRAHRPQDMAPLYDALAGAQRGLRKLLTLGEGALRAGPAAGCI